MAIMTKWFKDIEKNADFYSNANQEFYVRVLKDFNYQTEKPIVFLPCAKTKPISKSRTHCYLSAITRNSMFEKIIISEPQTIIPYSMEKYSPNYDYPPGNLDKKDRWQMVRRLAIFLGELHDANPDRTTIYYIGAKHHFSVLNDANNISKQFRIIFSIPYHGIRDYAKCAKELSQKIRGCENE